MIKNIEKIKKDIEELNKLFKADSKNIVTVINLANAYLSIGDFINGKKYTKLANEISPENLGVDYTLSNLINYNNENYHQEKMLLKLKDNNIPEKNKIPLYFALGKSFNDQKNYEKSYEYFKLGNAIKNSTLLNYNLDVEEFYIKKIKEIFYNYNFNITLKNNLYKKKIIFVLGLPRTGTTLVHQILASHSKIFGLGESKILNGFFNSKILDKNFMNNFYSNNTLNYELISKISSVLSLEYEKFSKIEILIDKSPFNFFWIGFIKIIFPNAIIIHTSRNIEDTCISIYKTLFGKDGVLWSYNKNNIVKYVSIYKDIMKFWKMKLPNYLHDINYEELVSNQEEESKKMIKFCGLNWEKNCLEFYKNTTPVKSASLYQTRNPMYKSSVKQNLNYSKFINFNEKINKN